MDPRERLALPLRLADGLSAITRDISPAGLYFIVEGEHVLRGPVDFELQLPEISMRFTASGEIVRLESGGGVTGIAVRFVDPQLHRLEEGQ